MKTKQRVHDSFIIVTTNLFVNRSGSMISSWPEYYSVGKTEIGDKKDKQ